MFKCLKNKKGLTLIEILVSISILSIIIIPIYSLFISSAKMSYLSNNKMNATNIAQRYMEKIKASETLDWIPTETFSDGEFNIKITVDEEEDYQFMDGLIGDQIDDISYDFKITLEKDNSITITDTTGFSKPYINDPMNEINIEFKNNQLIIHSTPIDDTVDNPETTGEGAEVRIELYGNEDISVYAYNEEDMDLIFYIIKEKDSESGLNVINNGGSIVTYSNIIIGDENSSEYNYRLYRIEIEVSKEGELMEKLVGYKTFID
jgi:prepilin-type N-terminal cleavage/methylation domain-containing protein